MSIWRSFFLQIENQRISKMTAQCSSVWKDFRILADRRRLKQRGGTCYLKANMWPFKNKNSHTHTHTRARCKDGNFAPVNGTRLETLILIFNQGSKTDFKGHWSWQFYFLLQEEERWISVKPDHSQNNCSPDISKWVCKRKYSGNWSY